MGTASADMLGDLDLRDDVDDVGREEDSDGAADPHQEALAGVGQVAGGLATCADEAVQSDTSPARFDPGGERVHDGLDGVDGGDDRDEGGQVREVRVGQGGDGRDGEGEVHVTVLSAEATVGIRRAVRGRVKKELTFYA